MACLLLRQRLLTIPLLVADIKRPHTFSLQSFARRTWTKEDHWKDHTEDTAAATQLAAGSRTTTDNEHFTDRRPPTHQLPRTPLHREAPYAGPPPLLPGSLHADFHVSLRCRSDAALQDQRPSSLIPFDGYSNQPLGLLLLHFNLIQ
jgi:hypothetical protein